MNIGARPIAADAPVYIIAELGVNHDGSVERALDLTRAAAAAGADAVKLQLFDARMLMSRASRLAAYQQAAGEDDPVSMLERLQLSASDMQPIVRLAHALGIHAVVTVFSVPLVEHAERLAFDAYKTASPDIVNRPLLHALRATGKPLIISTGAANADEVARTAEWLVADRDRVAYLQCVSSYPCPQDMASLGGIAALAEITARPAGYSDHTPGELTGAYAGACGAVILEKHLTYDCSAKGPDHAASLDPAGLARYVAHVRRSVKAADVPAAMIGPRAKNVLPCEQDVRRVSRQSVVAARGLSVGQVLAASDLTVKRPGTGISAWDFEAIRGRRLARPVDHDVPLQWEDLEHQGPEVMP